MIASKCSLVGRHWICFFRGQFWYWQMKESEGRTTPTQWRVLTCKFKTTRLARHGAKAPVRRIGIDLKRDKTIKQKPQGMPNKYGHGEDHHSLSTHVCKQAYHHHYHRHQDHHNQQQHLCCLHRVDLRNNIGMSLLIFFVHLTTFDLSHYCTYYRHSHVHLNSVSSLLRGSLTWRPKCSLTPPEAWKQQNHCWLLCHAKSHSPCWSFQVFQ